MRIVSYNSHGLHLGRNASDKAQCLVIDKLLEETDILCLQETILAQQDLDKLNSVHNDFHGVGESTTDFSLGLVHGRIPGGVSIMWHNKYDTASGLAGMTMWTNSTSKSEKPLKTGLSLVNHGVDHV